MTTGAARGETVASTLLGGVIRQRRLAEKLTLAQLSAQTGLSSSFISQLENGRTNTSLRSLQRIADALGTTATVLLADADTDDDPLTRADDVRLALDGEQGAQARSVIRGRRQLRALEFNGDVHDDREFTHDNDELLYVVAGRVSVTLTRSGDERTETLTTGDALYIDGGLEHRWQALTSDARVLVVAVADDMTVRRSPRLR